MRVFLSHGYYSPRTTRATGNTDTDDTGDGPHGQHGYVFHAANAQNQESIIYRFATLATLKALGVIRAVMFSAGCAALVATFGSWLITSLGDGVRPAWASSLQTFGLEIAVAFLPAAIAAAMLMPRVDEMTRPIRSDERAIAPGVLLLLGALGVVALLQAPSVGAWWAEDRALLTQLLGTSPDPLGFSVIPKVMLFSLPTLAAMALTLFVLTSILGMLTCADLGLHALGACVALQSGLVIGLHLVLHAVRSVGGAIQGLFTTSPDAEASAQALEWFARHDAASLDASWRLVWILGGYLVAVAAAGLATSRR